MADDNWYNNPNLYERPGCVLQADGTGFEPEAFLRQTTFEPEAILFYGKLGFPNELKIKVAEEAPEGLTIFETTFLLLELSKTEAKLIQLEDAKRFLEQNRDELLRLRNFPQVENMYLKFSSNDELSDNVVDEFMGLAGDCGVDGIFI